MVSAQAVKWLHRFYGVKAPNLSLRGGQRPTWRPEREARGSALGVQSREGSCVFAGAFLLSNCVLRDCHVASLLAMTHQVVRRCTSALLPLNGSVQGGHYPQGARRIRKAAKPPTAAQGAPLQSNLAARAVGDGLYGLQLPSRDCHVALLLAMTNLWLSPFYR